MPKFVFMPPQDDLKQMFAARLADTLPELEVASPDTDDEAIEAIRDADAACGWVPPAALEAARKARVAAQPRRGPLLRLLLRRADGPPPDHYQPPGHLLRPHQPPHPDVRDGAVPGGCHGTWTPSAAGSGRRTPGSRPTSTWPRPRRSSTASAASATRPPGYAEDLGDGGHRASSRARSMSFPTSELHTPDELDAVLPRADFVISTVPTHTRDGGDLQRRAF